MRGYIAFVTGYLTYGTYVIIKQELEMKEFRRKIKSM